MNVNIDILKSIHTHKTAVLLKISCACGANIAGADDEEVAHTVKFATQVGLAITIVDYVLVVTASTKVLGKTAGKDVAASRVTFPRLPGIDGSRGRTEALIQGAKAALEPFANRAKTLLALAVFIIYRSNLLVCLSVTPSEYKSSLYCLMSRYSCRSCRCIEKRQRVIRLKRLCTDGSQRCTVAKRRS